MKSLLGIVEALGSLILEHYGDKVKGIIIGGEAIENLDEKKPLFLLLILEKTHKISFYAREEIIEYFMKKIESSDIYLEYIKKYGQRPLIYTIILDPKEVVFHNPILLYLISNGIVLLDIDKIIEKEKSSVVREIISMKGTIKISNINKGEVVDL